MVRSTKQYMYIYIYKPVRLILVPTEMEAPNRCDGTTAFFFWTKVLQMEEINQVKFGE